MYSMVRTISIFYTKFSCTFRLKSNTFCFKVKQTMKEKTNSPSC